MRLAALLLVLATPATAASYAELQAADPGRFHPETGYRIDRQHAPTPDDIPGPAKSITPEEARALVDAGALPVDVFGALQSRYDELDGTWLVGETRMSLPGAIWLPETGRGTLTDEMQSYLETELDAATAGDRSRPLVVFCVADCWMGWNAAQRIAGLGYTDVSWMRLGTDGWAEIGAPLEAVEPTPVPVE